MLSTRFSPITARPIRPMSAVGGVIAGLLSGGNARWLHDAGRGAPLKQGYEPAPGTANESRPESRTRPRAWTAADGVQSRRLGDAGANGEEVMGPQVGEVYYRKGRSGKALVIRVLAVG